MAYGLNASKKPTRISHRSIKFYFSFTKKITSYVAVCYIQTDNGSDAISYARYSESLVTFRYVKSRIQISYWFRCDDLLIWSKIDLFEAEQYYVHSTMDNYRQTNTTVLRTDKIIWCSVYFDHLNRYFQTQDHARAALAAPKARPQDISKDFVHELSAEVAYANFISRSLDLRAS